MAKSTNPVRVSFFALGQAFGVANSAITVDAAIELQYALGMDDLTIGAYSEARDAWVAGYMKGYECTEKSAVNRWAELFALTGVKKPQTLEAKRKAELRAAKAKADKANPAGKAVGVPLAPIDQPDVPASGVDAAKGVQLELSAIEQNLIKWYREGKFAMIEALIASKAE